MSKVIHVDVMQMNATPEQVLRFIITPERVMDYYPGAIDCGTFVEGKAIWCSTKQGVSLLELIDTPAANKLSLRVLTANGVKPPYSIEQIEAHPFLTIIEDFEVVAKDGGTQLTKTWRDIIKHKMKFLPMGFIIRSTAKGEHQRQIDAWDFNAQLERDAVNV